MALITSTRMYDVAPPARQAWGRLLALAYERAGLQVETVPHGWPTPIGELWARTGLCGAFMCGWPLVQALGNGQVFHLVAGVVPDWPVYEGKPRYRSEFLVREDSGWGDLPDTFGSRYGWMVRDSQSGWNAPRAVLATFARAVRGRAGSKRQQLYAQSRGPYGNPRALLAALHEREIDVTAVDGWYLDLLRAHDPAILTGVRTIAYTPWTPNPPLVAGPDVAPGVVTRLRDVLLGLPARRADAALLAAAHVARFVVMERADYAVLDTMASNAHACGYPEIA